MSSAIVHHCHWRALLDVVPMCDALIVDAPYSEKTHAGHDAGAVTAGRAKAWAERCLSRGLRSNEKHERRYAAKAKAGRQKLDYGFWTPDDIRQFVEAWSPRTRGWFVTLTDDQLAPHWAAALDSMGRLVFSPLACVEPGSRVRMSGDGPSQWSCWAIVARPRSVTYSKWGALRGAYIPGDDDKSPRFNGGKSVIGGKPIWLMEHLVEDYSRPGALVVDPCCGGGTTGVAAVRHGRRFVGGDQLEAHVQIAREAIEAEISLTTVKAGRAGQVPLFGNIGT